MNWMRLSRWRTGNGVPTEGFDLYLDGRTATKADVTATLAAGVNCGLYFGTTPWYPGATPQQFVDEVHAQVKFLIPQAYPLPTQNQGAPVMLDLEPTDYEWTQTMVSLFRQAMPSRETAFTTEPWKGDGRILPFVALRGAGFHWYPQCYDNNGAIDSAAVILNACRAYPSGMVHPFYKETLFPPNPVLDGCVFP